LIHVPASYDGRSAVALVIALHGGGGLASGMPRLTGIDVVSDRHGFIAVYPAGLNRHWKDGRTAELSGSDDVAFIDALIRKLEVDYRIDPKRVYATGISNGAIFSLRLACELGGEIAAVAPVAGSNPANFKGDCGKSPVSVMMINGTADAFVPYAGGPVAPDFLGNRGEVASVGQTISFWVAQDGCRRTPRTEAVPDKDPSDDTTTDIEMFDGCRGRTSVELYTVDGGGHTWPGGLQYLPESIIGSTSRDFDASETMWQFFAAHPRR
jgi:polyhydroxybutyrate depolymerase